MRSPEDIYDEWLVLRCQGGDRRALAELVGRFQPRLHQHARRLTGNADGAADALQEAWLAVVRGIGRLDDPAAFRPWAYRILANKCADCVRRRRRSRSEQITENGELIAPPDDHDQAGETVRRLLRRLPRERRALLAMYYLDAMSVGEIAAVLGVAAGTVKSRLHHARNELKRALERTEP